MERLAVFWFAFSLIGVGAWTATNAQSTDETVGRFIRDQMLNNVVVIRTDEQQGGLGFIIGRADDTLWVATAAHVLFPGYESGQLIGLEPVGRIEVQRRNDSRIWRPNGKPELGVGESGTRIDLAFLPVRMPLGEIGVDLWRERVVVTDPEAGEQIWIAGKPDGITYDDGKARVSESSEGSWTIEELNGEEGQSGAPVATARGFIGMYTGIYTQSAGQHVIPIAIIREAALQAERPWQLTDVPPKPVAVRVCLETRGSQRAGLSLNGPAGIVSLDRQGCATTESGRNKVVPESGWVRCEPDAVVLPPEPEQRLIVTCSVNPQGPWRSSSFGFLQVEYKGERVWRINGLNMSPYGWIAGELQGEPPNLWVDAETSSGAPVTGSLTLEPRRLHGQLLVSGFPLDLELTR